MRSKISEPTNRRDFVKLVTGGIIGGMTLLSVPASSKARYVVADNGTYSPTDEKFWKLVKEQFPIIKNMIWMNNGTMGPSPYVVQEAMYAKESDVNATGNYSGYDNVRPKLAKMIGCDKEEISLTMNVTNGINIISQGLKLKKGDEVILTNHEHIGNAMPWMARAKRDGIVLKFVNMGKDSNDMLNKINDLITSKTRMIAVPHQTCTQGQVLPGKQISKLGHDKGLWVMLDAAHPVGQFPVDVKDLDCDFYVTCGHKWMMGPKGTGFLYMKKSMYDVVEPLFVGAGGETNWGYEKGLEGYVNTGHRYDYTTRSAALSVGLEAAADFLFNIGMENVGNRGRALATHLIDGIKDIPNVEILTPLEDKSRASLVGFKLKNIEFGKLQGWLMENYKIRVRGVSESELNSLRISTHIYNDFDDINKLIEAVDKASKL
jgi:selenocysteine lyase/cysteine desulfurase